MHGARTVSCPAISGAEAAHLLLLVLDAMDSAVANADNLAALRDRALAVLDVMAVYADQLRGLQRYKEVVGRYRDVLQVRSGGCTLVAWASALPVHHSSYKRVTCPLR